MDTLEFWILYIVTVFVASIIPGPSMFLALSHGLQHGTRISTITALGNTVASMIQATIAIYTLDIVLSSSSTMFLFVKYLGAFYLIYLGIKLFKTPFSIQNQHNLQYKKPVLKKIFSQSFIVAASNPKAIIFFTALFPQFIKESTASLTHYFLLVFILGLIAFLSMMIYSFSASKVKIFLSSAKISKYIGKTIGSIFVSFGLGLAFVSK